VWAFLLYTLYAQVVDEILRAISQLGWVNGPYNDDNLSHKSIYPGHVHKATNSKLWPSRLTNNEHSFMIHIQRINFQYENAASFFRRKKDKNEMITVAERAAAVWNLGQELMAQFPIKPETVKERFYKAWIQGEHSIETDIESALMDKSDRFDLRDLSIFRTLIDEHMLNKPTASSSTHLQELETDQFNLAMKQAEYDITAMRVTRFDLICSCQSQFE
jgi:hypothetical protein